MVDQNPEPPSDDDADSSPVDPDFLVEIVRRSDLLAALQAEPASASDLADRVDLSRSTIHRATDSLTDANLIEKVDGAFRLTGYGTVMAKEVGAFRQRVEATQRLEPFLANVDMTDFPVEHFAKATVIQPKPRQPHYSVRRIMELIEETNELQVFSTVISPFYVEIAHREMLDGMNATAIFDEQTIDIVLEEYREQTQEAIESGHFDVYIHNDLPFELFLFDRRIGMAAHDEHGIPRVLVVSESSEAVAWGQHLFESYLEEAQTVPTPST